MSKYIVVQCSKCGADRGIQRSERANSLCKRCSHSAPKKDGLYKNKDWLEHNYISLNRSLKNIADEFGVREGSVHRFVKKFDLSKDKQSISNSIRTNSIVGSRQKYGVDNPFQAKEVIKKISKQVNNSTSKIHWKTGEELTCQGGYEAKVVDYLNDNKIDFDWQIRFAINDNKYYICDLYLKDLNLYVEIKGFWRQDAVAKWDSFCKLYPTLSKTIWDKEELIKRNIL